MNIVMLLLVGGFAHEEDNYESRTLYQKGYDRRMISKFDVLKKHLANELRARGKNEDDIALEMKKIEARMPEQQVPKANLQDLIRNVRKMKEIEKRMLELEKKDAAQEKLRLSQALFASVHKEY